MLLVNQKQLLVAEALRDVNNPMNVYAEEYSKGLKELKEKFGKTIKFVRPGFPVFNAGADSEGRDAILPEPTSPALFPLQTYLKHPTRGAEVWACCLELPKLLPNGLWDIGRKVSISIEESKTVNIDEEPDLAYYLYYISRANKGGRLKVDDPLGEIKKKAAKERELVNRKTAIWDLLSDESILRKMAAAYDVFGAFTKDPDALRFDLETQLSVNDEKRKRDPSIKGTKEFLEEMKITDNIRLRAFIKKLLDENVMIHKLDGRLWIGEKVLMQIPQSEIQDKFNYICNFYSAPNNIDKLSELMKDIVNKEFLDNIKDDKEFNWLAKVMGIQIAFKKKEELRNLVYDAFNIAL